MAILVIHHRDLLGKQLEKHIQSRRLWVEIEQGSRFANHKADVVVATVQTLNSSHACRYRDFDGQHPANCDRCLKGKWFRMMRFNRDHFSHIVIDEGHHATARSYRRVMKWFAAANILLVTATPNRGDGVGMHNVCDSVAYDELQLPDAINEGWLVPIRQQFVQVTGLHLERVASKKGGDFADGQLEAEMIGEDGRTVHEVAASLSRIAAGRRTIVFSPGKEHAKKLTEALNSEHSKHGTGTAECIIQDTLPHVRDSIVERLRRGETTFLVNVMVCTEGFDVPDVEIVANCRPTRSVTLLAQMIGRGTRPLKGVVDGPATAAERRAAIAASAKPFCLVLDYVGTSRDVKIVTVADLLAGTDVTDDDIQAAADMSRDAVDPADVAELLQRAMEARKEKEAKAEAERLAMAAHRSKSVEYQATDVPLFGDGPTWKEKIEHYQPAVDGATEKQVKLLCNAGWTFEAATALSKWKASGVIGKLMKQAAGPDYRITFGKHAGKCVKDLPGGYRRWMMENAKPSGALLQSLNIVAGKVPVAAAVSVPEEVPF